ncbi:MAG: aldehyde dehydrogenase family protein [Planctomycetes bacterium]|nr:aldehyde dehydrogenase family protein [Planctomycetota bacterium]
MPAAPAPPIDATVLQLQRAAAELRRRSHADLAALAAACGTATAAAAPGWVEASRAAKGWTAVADSLAEEWASGPLPVARFLRVVGRRHADLALGRPGPQPRGTGLDVVPTPGFGDRLLLRGVRARLECAGPPQPSAPPRYGDVALVLGAGNVTAAPLLDTIDQVLLRGRAVLLKLSPLHASLANPFAAALAPLCERGLVCTTVGDAALGAALAAHPAIAAVHLTGSVATAAQLRADPRLRGKALTAELGGCTPAFVLPGEWSLRALHHVAAQLAGFVAWNGGATCVAPRLVVTARGWPQRPALLAALHAALAALPSREPFHPAVRRAHAQALGTDGPAGPLPPRLRADLDLGRDAALLAHEAFAPVLLELPVAGASLADWLDAATGAVRDHAAGGLSAYVFAPPPVLAAARPALAAALGRLPHGTLATNTWAGLGFGLGSTPWGVPADAPWQHGIGFARDVFGLPDLRRVALEAPFASWPPPPWSPGRRGAAAALQALTRHYAHPSPRHLAATVFHACR